MPFLATINSEAYEDREAYLATLSRFTKALELVFEAAQLLSEALKGEQNNLNLLQGGFALALEGNADLVGLALEDYVATRSAESSLNPKEIVYVILSECIIDYAQTRSDELVEQGRFADIGSADDCNNRF